MEPLTFRELATLINHTRTTRLDLDPSRQGRGWTLYSGSHRVHAARYPFSVLYLSADATKTATEEALHDPRINRETTHVVYAPSLDNQKWIRDVLETSTGNKWNTREYLRSFMGDELKEYTNQVSEVRPKHFIDPRIEVPAGFVKKTPNPVLSSLLDDAGSARDGMLAVVLADPGQGKTYMSQFLVSRLIDAKYVPIYINSSQWKGLTQLPMSVTVSPVFSWG